MLITVTATISLAIAIHRKPHEAQRCMLIKRYYANILHSHFVVNFLLHFKQVMRFFHCNFTIVSSVFSILAIQFSDEIFRLLWMCVLVFLSCLFFLLQQFQVIVVDFILLIDGMQLCLIIPRFKDQMHTNSMQFDVSSANSAKVS